MMKTLVLALVSVFAVSAVAFANESANTNSNAVVTKAKKMKKAKKAKKAKEAPAAEAAPAAPAEGAAH